MRNGKLFVFALFISILGACATTSSVSSKTSLPHPRPARFWENGQASAQVLHVFDRQETDPVTGEVKTGMVTLGGSSAVVSVDGLILTNSHVVDATAFEPEGAKHNIDAVLVCKTERGERQCEKATIVAIDKDHDLALLKTKLQFDEAVTFGPDNELKPGDEIYSWGIVTPAFLSPLFGHYTNRLSDDISVWMNGKERVVKAPFLLMDLRVGHGSSGGPMFDSLGRCIGITSMMYFNPEGGPTFGIIIPSATITEFLKKNWPKE